MTYRFVALTTIVALAATAAVGAQTAASNAAKLRTPAALNEKAPDTYKAKFDTSVGVIVVQVHRDWGPLGADRFYNMVKNGFFDEVRFFRVVPNFMVQFGMHGNPAVTRAWSGVPMKDEPT